MVTALVVLDRLQGNASVPTLGFPGLKLVFFDEALHRAHRKIQQLGCVTGAAIIIAGFWNGFVTHEGILLQNVPSIQGTGLNERALRLTLKSTIELFLNQFNPNL